MLPVTQQKRTMPARTGGAMAPMRFPAWGFTTDMDRLFRQLMTDWGTENEWLGKAWNAPLSMHTEGDRFLVDVELPGVRIEDVDVTVDHGVLTVIAERRLPAGDPKFAANDRFFGRMERTVTLPEGLETENPDAELRDGVLHLAFRKVPAEQPRKVAIRTATPAAG